MEAKFRWGISITGFFLFFQFEFNEDGVFIHHFENLPVELKRYIASERDRITPKDLGTILDYPIVDSDNS